jgi:5-methylcytosine-specific restriction endonuclease McrA
VFFRRRRRRAPGHRIDPQLRRRVLQRDGYRCQYCGRYTQRPHIDHVKPRSKGGKDTLGNLRVACPACNLSKSDKVITGLRTSTKVRRYRRQRKRELRGGRSIVTYSIVWLGSWTIRLAICAAIVFFVISRIT